MLPAQKYGRQGDASGRRAPNDGNVDPGVLDLQRAREQRAAHVPYRPAAADGGVPVQGLTRFEKATE
jgi:hypothetical protein